MILTWQESSSVENSIIDFLRTNISCNNIKLLDKYGHEKTLNVYGGRELLDSWELPMLQVYLDNQQSTRLELGTDLRIRYYYVVIDIRAELPGQEINIADWAASVLNNGLHYYRYTPNLLSPNIPVKVLSGYITLDFFTSNSVPVYDDADIFDQNRYRIVLKTWVN
jgi:hypothetical protein